MQYQTGKIGKVIVAQLDEGEDLYESVHSLARNQHIRSGMVLITGGSREADVVVGPSQEDPKIVPTFKHFDGPGEIFGLGTIFWDTEGPKLHLHAGFGKGDQTVVGCPRGGAKTFLTLEVVIIELENIRGMRKMDEQKGVALLNLTMGM